MIGIIHGKKGPATDRGDSGRFDGSIIVTTTNTSTGTGTNASTRMLRRKRREIVITVPGSRPVTTEQVGSISVHRTDRGG